MSHAENFIIHNDILKKYTGTETDIILPDGIRKIECYAFSHCHMLTSITFRGELKEIGAFAFIGCEHLKEIMIPHSVTKLGEGIFSECTDLEHIAVSSENPIFHSENDCLMETNTGILVCGCRNSKIPEETREIAPYAFAGCKGFLRAELPNGLNRIGDMAFLRCSRLETVFIPDSVTHIGKSAFERCLRLREIRLPTEIKEIRESTFALCAGLLEIEIPMSVEKIEKAAFAFCKNLKRVHIPKSVFEIGALAFFRCSALPYVILSDKIVFADAIGEDIPIIGTSLELSLLEENMRLQAAAGYALAMQGNLASYSKKKKQEYLAFIRANREELLDFPKAKEATSRLLNELL